MSKAFIDDTNLTNIANSIRSKLGVSDTYLPSEMAEAIQNIPKRKVIDFNITPKTLDNAEQNSLQYVKAFGKTKQQNLPDGYIELEYIDMEAGSYLLTNLIPTYDCRVYIDLKTTADLNGTIFGARDIAQQNSGMLFSRSSLGEFLVDAFGVRYDSAIAVLADTRYRYSFSNRVATLEIVGGSVLFTKTFSTTGTTNYSLAINAVNTAGSIAGNSAATIFYSFKMWNNQGVIVADYVPCIKQSTSEVGVYDNVSKTFKGATNGTFTAGPGVSTVPTPTLPVNIMSNNGALKARHESGLPLGYTLLDYIVFDGTQVIDTGFTPNQDSKIVSKFNGSTLDSWVYGTGTTNPRITCYLSATGNQRFGNVIVDNTNISRNTINTVTQDKNGFYYNNGQGKPYTSVGTFTAQATLTIGNSNQSTGTPYFSGNFYYLKIYDNGTLVRDYVACKDSSNVVGFYDLVNGTFITDTGLTAGNTVSDPTIIYTEGDTETIRISSENLFDKNDYEEINAYVNSDTHKLTQGSPGSLTQYSAVIPCKPNTTYFIDGRSTSAWGSFTSKAIGTLATVFNNDSDHITTGANDVYLIGLIRANNNAIDYRDTFVLKQESTATAEMLLKAGDHQDVQSILDGVVTRNVGVKVLDGTENWQRSSTYVGSCYLVGFAGAISDKPIYNTHFVGHAGTAGYSVGMSLINNSALSIWKSSDTTPTTLKQWLAQQYAAGTPVIIIYPLATPITESVVGQTLQVEAGDNTLEITQSSLSNLEVECEYFIQ